MASDPVDVVMATYNGGKYLGQQIQSIMDQPYPSLHLYIRDDLSQDNTLEIMGHYKRLYPDRITLIPSMETLGVKGNFSILLQNSKANYVLLSDQDDVWLPDKVEMTLAKMRELEEIYGASCPLCVHTDLTVVDTELQKIHSSFWAYSHLNQSGVHDLNRLLIQNVVTGCTMMINRALIKLALPIPPAAIIHDWWLGLVGHCVRTYRRSGKSDDFIPPAWPKCDRS